MSETGLSDPGVQVFHTRHSVSQSHLGPQRSHHADWNNSHPTSVSTANPALSSKLETPVRLPQTETNQHEHVYNMPFTMETGHFDGHILAGNKVACFPECLLLHFITEGEEQHFFFLLAHNLSVMWVWHKMTAVSTAGHLLAFQWWLY